MKLAVVTCYFMPDYVRAQTIRQGLQAQPDTDVIVVKNSRLGFGRYFEVIWKLLRVRWRDKPDAYVLTFRGYELLPFVLLLAGRKPVILDELINPVLLVQEHRSQKHGFQRRLMGLAVWLGGLYYLFLRRCRFIIADTSAHAAYSAHQARLPTSKIITLPVSTEESVFYPRLFVAAPATFTVFFYGLVMAPLHGLDYMLEAAVAVRDLPDIQFHIVGGKKTTALNIQAAQAAGARITYEQHVPYEQLAAAMAAADLCLGGPFGASQQADNVITGKTYQMIAMGRPTVVGANPMTSAEFTDRVDCLLVERASGQALAQAIRWAYDNPVKLAEIGVNGYKLYQKKFSSAVVRQRLAVMTRALASSDVRGHGHSTSR